MPTHAAALFATYCSPAALQPLASATPAPSLTMGTRTFATELHNSKGSVPHDCFHRRYDLFYIRKLLMRAQVQLLKQDDADHFFFFEAPSKKPYLSNAMPWGPTDKAEGVY